MFRLLIVDDEKLERDAIEYVIRGSHLPAEEIRKAANGREAIEYAETFAPDIVIMDIRMPGISGIEAARVIRQKHPACRVVFLTAFSSFEYAQDAIRLGAVDFIIKPADDSLVIETLKNIMHSLEKEREDLHRRKERENRFQLVSRYFGSELLASLIAADLEETRIMEYLSLMEIERCTGYGCILRLAYEAYHLSPVSAAFKQRLMTRCLRKAESVLENLSIQFLSHGSGESVYLLIISGPGFRRSADELLNSLTATIEADLSLPVSAGLGSPFTDPSQIRSSFEEAETAVSSVRRGVNHFTGFASEPEIASRPECTEEDDLLEEGPRFDRSRKLTEEACRYIRLHFMDGITLDDVASTLGLSSFYLSRLFTQHRKMKFIDYLTAIRIEKAKELLREPTANIKTVSAGIGYRDPNYFSRVFKKVTGKSPTEYRDEYPSDQASISAT